MIKTIQMSGGLKEDEMDLQIRAEADQYLPFSQEDNEGVALDWEIEGESDNSSDMVDVILVACRSEAVERRKDAVEYAGIERSEEHTSELQSRPHLVCRLLLEKK